MGACEIAFISVLFVILLIWYYKAIYQSTQMGGACSREEQSANGATSSDKTSRDANAAYDYSDDDEDGLESPSLDGDGFAPGVGSTNMVGGTSQPVSELETFGDPDTDLSGAKHPDPTNFPQVFTDDDTNEFKKAHSNGTTKHKSRHSSAMAAERAWQLQNALAHVNQKGLRNRNAIGNQVGFQSTMDMYNGNPLPAPRKASACRMRNLHLPSNHPDADKMHRMSQAIMTSGGR